MKRVVRKIDRALKRLYNLETGYRAEDFLLSKPPAEGVGNAELHGTLYVRGADNDLSVGIYLSPGVAEGLADFGRWQYPWKREQTAAFSVATEEISHFLYLLYHAETGRGVSQLELELQGEIDKFVLAYFAGASTFEQLFEQLFYRFRLAESLSLEQKDRYLEANRLARLFIRRYGRYLSSTRTYEKAFRLLRRFYRLDSSEKIGWIGQ